MLENRFPVVAALDPPPDSPNIVEWILHKSQTLGEYVEGCKLGAAVTLPLGLGEVRSLTEKLRENGCPIIIADLKVADVPHTSKRMAVYAQEAGFDVIIAHAFPGPDVISQLKLGGLKVWLVAALSNEGSRLTMDPYLPYFIKIANSLNIDGLVLPATMPSLIRLARRLGWEGIIASPGIGAQGAKPCSALENGASLEIVGRRLVLNDNPVGWLAANYSECVRRKPS